MKISKEQKKIKIIPFFPYNMGVKQKKNHPIWMVF
jgi:hypothetical protein